MHILAYLDPGSGSALLQFLLGGIAAAGVALKLFWNRILTFLHLRKKEEEPRSETPAPERERAAADPR